MDGLPEYVTYLQATHKSLVTVSAYIARFRAEPRLLTIYLNYSLFSCVALLMKF